MAKKQKHEQYNERNVETHQPRMVNHGRTKEYWF